MRAAAAIEWRCDSADSICLLMSAGFVVDEALTPSKISTTTFGLKNSWDVDGAVYAQVTVHIPDSALMLTRLAAASVAMTLFQQ